MKKFKILTSTCAAIASLAPIAILSGCSCNMGGGDKPGPTPPTPPDPKVNDVSITSASEIDVTNGANAEFGFKLKLPLGSDEIVFTSTVETSSGNIDVEIKSHTFSDDYNFKLPIQIKRIVEPYLLVDNDYITFKLNIKIKTGDKVSVDKTFSLKITNKQKYTKVLRDRQLFNIDETSKVINGLNIGWQELHNYDTIEIPSDIIEVDSLCPNDLKSATKIKNIIFKEDNDNETSALYLSNKLFKTGFENVERINLPKRFFYDEGALYNLPNLKVLDISTWDEDNFADTAPFGEYQAFNITKRGLILYRKDLEEKVYDLFTTFGLPESWFPERQSTYYTDSEGIFRYRKVEGSDEVYLAGFNDMTKIPVGTTTLKIPDKVTKIDKIAFYNKFSEGYEGSINTIEISDKSMLTEIASSAFAYNTKITNLVINGNNIKKIGYSAFYNCTGLTKVVLPEQIEIIDAYCFGKCSSLKDINLSSTSITKIPSGLFSGCVALSNDSLKTILSDKIRWIGGNAFSSCKITEVTINDSVVYIGYQAFKNCSQLMTANISPQSQLVYLGDEAFKECLSLKSLYVPVNVYYIGDDVLTSCRYETITVDNKNKSYKSVDNCLYHVLSENNYELIIIGSTSTSICDQTSRITKNTFTRYTNESFNFDFSKTNIQVIDENAFYKIEGDKSIILPPTLTTINTNAFQLCSIGIDLTQAINLEFIKNQAFNKALFTAIDLSNCTKLKSLSDLTFNECSNLTSVSLPNSLVSFGKETFKKCGQLNLIDFSTFTSFPSDRDIGDNVFSNAANEGTIIVKKGTSPETIESLKTFLDNIGCPPGFREGKWEIIESQE